MAHLQGTSLENLPKEKLIELEAKIEEAHNRVLHQMDVIIREKVVNENPDYACPISGLLMRDPVVDACGATYDREFITTWFRQRRAEDQPLTSPNTNEILESDVLFPNRAINSRIRAEVDRITAEIGRPPKRAKP